MTLQTRLNQAYSSIVDRDQVIERLSDFESPDAILRELNGPFLIASNDQYEKATPKVVIVGQENNYWLDCDFLTFLSDQTLDDALDVYRKFDIAEYGHGSFGRYFSIFRDRIYGTITDENRRSILWNNLFKLNHDGKSSISSPHEKAILQIQGELFVDEIEILRPDVVIFLTGPNYDHIIQRFYPDTEFQEVDGHPLNEVAMVNSERLPKLCFRTYHPGYLNRVYARKPHCVEAILERIHV